MIDEFAERGFKGLKIINPRRNYDDPSYFPLYYEAEKHATGVPVPHGHLGGMIDYLQFPPGEPEPGAELAREHGVGNRR